MACYSTSLRADVEFYCGSIANYTIDDPMKVKSKKKYSLRLGLNPELGYWIPCSKIVNLCCLQAESLRTYLVHSPSVCLSCVQILRLPFSFQTTTEGFRSLQGILFPHQASMNSEYEFIFDFNGCENRLYPAGSVSRSK